MQSVKEETPLYLVLAATDIPMSPKYCSRQEAIWYVNFVYMISRHEKFCHKNNFMIRNMSQTTEGLHS